LAHTGPILTAAEAAFDSGQDALFDGDRAAARRHFERAIDLQSDFVDAHFWLSELEDDPTRKRDQLSIVLSLMPNHLDAVRRLMVLNGQMSAADAERSVGEPRPAITPLQPLPAKIAAPKCPQCGGRLTQDEARGRVVCGHCGYEAVLPAPASGSESLAAALLKRRGQAVHWHMGARVMACASCGAAQTVSKQTLSDHCRFCGSPRIALRDALDTFDQPDGLIPFRIAQSQAWDAIQERLNGLAQQLMNLLDSNRVKRYHLDGVYLPFWCFDAIAEIRTTQTTQLALDGGTSSYSVDDLMSDVLIAAANSPARHVVQRMARYDLKSVVPYAAEWLAEYPAQLYELEVDKASLDARERVAQHMRTRHNRETSDQSMQDSRNRQVNITRVAFAGVRSMDYRQLLLPMWIATLFEEDGDQRTALVNGQTGQVTFGETIKPNRQ